MGRFGNVRGNARREDWGMAVEVDESLFRVRLDNPVGALMVNTYVYRGPRELLVVDPGWPWTLEGLEQAIRDLGLGRSFVDVDAWLHTHTHIDHMGAAALLSEVSDAPHYAHTAVEPLTSQWHTYQNRLNDWTPWAREAFAEPDFGERVAESTRARKDGGIEFLLEAHGERSVNGFRGLEFGSELRVADLHLTFVDARGHGPYHGAFYEPTRGWLFAGDVVIATPTPICRAMKDDLRLYLDSVDRLEALDATLLLPGHGVQRSGDLSSAFDRSRGYHASYRSGLVSALEAADGPLSLLELGLAMTPNREALTPRSRWMVHLALIDSQLVTLEDENVVSRQEGPRFTL